MSDAAVRMLGVRKRFGATQAIDGLDVEIARGSFFGLLATLGR